MTKTRTHAAIIGRLLGAAAIASISQTPAMALVSYTPTPKNAADRINIAYCAKHPETPSSQDIDNMELAVQDVIKQSARDPSSVTFDFMQYAGFDHYYCGPVAYVCGIVNAKNGFGGYTGGQRYIFTTYGPHKGEIRIGVTRREEERKCGEVVE